MDQKLTGWIDLIINTGVSWGTKALEFFGVYTSRYANVILILIGVWLLSKIFKVKLNIGGAARG